MLKPVRFRKTGEVQPALSLVFTQLRAGKKSVNESLDGIRTWVIKPLPQFIWSRRQAGQVEEQSANQNSAARGGNRVNVA